MEESRIVIAMIKEKDREHQWKGIIMEQDTLNVRKVNFYDNEFKILRTTRWKKMGMKIKLF